MQINKAIIPVAGWGTRRLPITKVIEKAMLPIGNRPLADYVVEDCAKAGVKDVYIVIDEKPFSQIKAYYEENAALNNYLISRGKEDKLTLANTERDGLTIHFYAQKDVDKRYGNAEPVAQVVEEFGIDEPCMVLMGDDFVYDLKWSVNSFRVIIVSKGMEEPAIVCQGGSLSDKAKSAIQKASSNTVIYFSDIKVSSEAGSRTLDEFSVRIR